MTECDKLEAWQDVVAGSKFCAQSSAKNGANPSNDYNAGIRIVLPGGNAITWRKSDLDPGPARLDPLQAGSYGVEGTLACGPSGPATMLHVWIEPPSASADCTRTNSVAGTEAFVTIAIVVNE